MVYVSKPYKSEKQIAKESIEKIEKIKKNNYDLPSDNILATLQALFEYIEKVEDRFETMLEVNHLWDGS